MARYPQGQPIRLSTTVRDVNGQLTNAGTLTLTVSKPDGSTQIYSSPTSDGTGLYHQDIAAADINTLGHYGYKWVSTGTGAGVSFSDFEVVDPLEITGYTTLPELKAALNIPVTDTADDDDLQDAILTASRAVDGDCQRHFYKLTEPRTLQAIDPYRLRLGAYSDLVSITTLKTDADGDGAFETTWQAGDYQLLCQDGTPNVNAGPEPRPYQRIRAIGNQVFPTAIWVTGRADRVQITGVWGWPAVPDRIRRATRLMAIEIFKLNTAPFGAIGMADLGIIRVRDNPKYQRLINDYRLLPVPVA
jgi:hypothetical protein